MSKRSKSSKGIRSSELSTTTPSGLLSDVRPDGEDADTPTSVGKKASRRRRHSANRFEAKAATKANHSSKVKAAGQRSRDHLLPDASSTAPPPLPTTASGQQSSPALLAASQRTPSGSQIAATERGACLSETPASTTLRSRGVVEKPTSTGAPFDQAAAEAQHEAAAPEALPRQPDTGSKTAVEEKLRVVAADRPSLTRLQEGESTSAVAKPTPSSARRASLSRSAGNENVEVAWAPLPEDARKPARRSSILFASSSRGAQSPARRRAETATPVTFACDAIDATKATNAADSALTGTAVSTRQYVTVIGPGEERNAEQSGAVPVLAAMSMPMLEVTTDSVLTTAPIETTPIHPRQADTKARGVLFTVLHCLSQAMVNILIKQLVKIPKTKMAYYVSFGYLMGNMPEAFALANPFGPRHVQVDLMLRGLTSLMSLMLKVEALQYIVVSDLAVVYTLVPLCVMVLSWYFLGEGMSVTMWTSISLCLGGIIVVMRPTIFFEEWDAEQTQKRFTGFMYAFGSALSLVAMIVLIRITRHATSKFLGFNSGLIRTMLALTMCAGAGSFGDLLDGRFLGMLVMMGKLSFCSIFFLGKALQKESGAFVTTVKFSADIIISVILQMAFLNLYPDFWTIGGILLVVLSFMVTTCGHCIAPPSWREPRRRKSSARSRRHSGPRAQEERATKGTSSGFKPRK